MRTVYRYSAWIATSVVLFLVSYVRIRFQGLSLESLSGGMCEQPIEYGCFTSSFLKIIGQPSWQNMLTIFFAMGATGIGIFGINFFLKYFRDH